MLWRTHVLAGIASLWWMQAIPDSFTGTNLGLLSALAVLGALLPDLDATESKVKHISVASVQPFAPVSVLMNRSYRHRGSLHSLGGLATVAALSAPFTVWFGWQAPSALVLGYASHIFLDACTKSGVPLWRASGRRLHLLPRPLRFVTGSQAEEALTALLGVAVLVLLLQALPFAAIP